MGWIKWLDELIRCMMSGQRRLKRETGEDASYVARSPNGTMLITWMDMTGLLLVGMSWLMESPYVRGWERMATKKDAIISSMICSEEVRIRSINLQSLEG